MTRTILLVEDDANDAFFMKIAFEAAQVHNPLQVVSDGQQALAYLSGSGKYRDRFSYPFPYLILLDVKLPYLMGLEVLKWIRQRSEFDPTIVIVLTSSEDPHDLEEAYRLRANAYLVKPSGLEQLQVLAHAIKNFWLIHNVSAPEFSRQALLPK